MPLLSVNVEGLRVLAARCDALSDEVGSVGTVGSRVSSQSQATAAAVARVHDSACAAGQTMAVRLRATATKLTAAGAAMNEHEQSAAVQLSLEM